MTAAVPASAGATSSLKVGMSPGTGTVVGNGIGVLPGAGVGEG